MGDGQYSIPILSSGTLDGVWGLSYSLCRRPAGPLPQGMPNLGGFFFAPGEGL